MHRDWMLFWQRNKFHPSTAEQLRDGGCPFCSADNHIDRAHNFNLDLDIDNHIDDYKVDLYLNICAYHLPYHVLNIDFNSAHVFDICFDLDIHINGSYNYRVIWLSHD